MAYIQDVQESVPALPEAGNLTSFVVLSQNENGRKLLFKIVGVDIPSGSTATFSGTKPDGVVYSTTGTISGNIVTVNEDTQMTAVAGSWDAKIRVLNGGNVIASAKVRMTIDADPVDPGAIPSDSQLDGIVAECQAYAEEARSSAYGSPLTASTAAGMIDKTRVYVYTGSETGYTNGHWYYWDGSAWADGGTYNSSGIQTDTTLTIAGMAADAKAAGDEITDLKEELENLEGLTVEYKESSNLHNPAGDVPGVLLYTGKSINSSGTGITTGFIPVTEGDTVYYTAITSTGAYAGIVATNCRWLAFYSAEDMATAISCNAYQNSVTVPSGAKYLRATFSDSSRLLHSITLNSYPASLSDMQKYFPPYYQNLAKPIVNTNVIDCWGESRTAMKNDGTSYTDYLQTLLGSSYAVCNYGISSQSSGNCAMRLGANEVFVSVEGNTIPASGSVALSAIKSIPADQFSVYAFDANATSPCIIGGVRGRLNRSNTSSISGNTFIRDCEGSAVTIRPYSKVCVDDMGSDRHICVFWWGKNDYYKYQGNSPNPQILTNYQSAVQHINHDYFVIVGETCSLTSVYEPGGTARVILDALNTQLASLYPDHFIDMNAWLSSTDALTSVGLTPSATDEEYIAKGWPCYQLMEYSTNTSDTVHPNAYGRQAIANRIHAWLKGKGWV